MAVYFDDRYDRWERRRAFDEGPQGRRGDDGATREAESRERRRNCVHLEDCLKV